ncbi:MAG: hypothetical protein JSV18_07670 [Candidatus Bathyarchaeota archaeon]|nr:MAG: hypothetical protein JSV18_07670 [Candidatus Bathyarchaeota archaeon]
MGKRWDPESPEEIAELLDMISGKLPNLIKGIIESFFSPEAAKNMGEAVAAFRTSLIEGGIPEDEALAMTREYLKTLTNWKGMIRETRRSGHHKEE